MYLKAQDDPQEIADVACAYNGATYEFNSVEGYIESPNYPNYYANYEECRWYLNPSGGIPFGQVSVYYLNMMLSHVTLFCNSINKSRRERYEKMIFS